EQANIVFTDNGIGISEENLSKIFEMFYRASEQSEGSGLGLYIVKNAVEKLGGHLNVSSRLNEGTTFEIVLPNKFSNSAVHAD
ncbi:MAG: HAMP domain-containing histidine kinase, partial [Cyclobacteriaceae bacterium]|nr:HAMP domain-containing histidine kinase [Cyclobacteriaceae bacterium]